MPSKPIQLAGKISFLYAAVAGLWVLFSDRVVGSLIPIDYEVAYLQTYLGLFFVAVTALLLYVLVRDYLQRYEAQFAERQQAETAFRESESRFRQLTESLPQLVWTCTPEGECDYLSPQWVEFTGIPAHEQLGRRWLQQLHPDDQVRLAEAWQASVASGLSFQTEYRLRHRDGTYRWFDDRAVPLRDADGRIVKWHGSITDIHEQHELRESLRRSEAKLRAIFEAEPECLKLIAADGTLREINPAGLHLLEAESLADVLGQCVVPCILPEHRANFLAMLEATARGEKRTLEFQILGFKGTPRWMEMSTVPFRDPATGKNLILGASRDTTGRRQAEEALRLSQERLRACIENTPNVALQQYDHQGRVIYWNEASGRVFGWSASEALGKTRDQLMQSAEQAARFRERVQTIARTGEILGPVECEFRRRDGTAGVCLSTLFAIPFDAQTSCFVSMDVEVTEIKQARTEAERSLSLLSATLESTADGILVVDTQRQITGYNRKFAELWRIPNAVLQTDDDEQVLAFVLDQLPDPAAFRAAIEAAYKNPESSKQHILSLKDGRTFEQDSQPQRLGRSIVGRVWSFRDVTERRRVEQLVVQSEQRLQLVWEQALLAMRLSDAEGNTVRVNLAYCQTVGKSRNELEGQPFAIAYAERDRLQALTNYRRRFQDHTEARQRVANVTYWNGRRAHLEVSDVFLEVAGQPTLLLTLINDVTLRHRAERRVAVLAEMARALSAATSRRTAAETIVEAAQELLGWDACFYHRYDTEREQIENFLSRDTLGGQVVDVTMPVTTLAISPFLLDVLRNGPQLILRSRPSPNAEKLIAFGDTQRRSESLMFVPVREGGRTIGLLSIQSYTPNAYDEASLATLQSLAEHAAGALERIHAEEVLQTREHQFRSLIENTSDMIAVVNRDGLLGFQSPSVHRVLGYGPEEMTGRNVMDFVHPEDVPAARAALARAITSPQKPMPFEGRLRHRDGSWRRLQTIGRRAPENSGEAAIILNSRDVTESRALEEQFRQSQRMEAIGQLAGGVAHDFNNLLAVILMQVELLHHESARSPEQLDAINEIGKAAKRAADLTRQLLLFSRRQAPKLGDFDLNEIVGQVTTILQRLLREDIRLQVHCAPTPLFIHADNVMVDQILLNLAVNARDAMPHGGRLVIETSNTEFASSEAALSPQPGSGTSQSAMAAPTVSSSAVRTMGPGDAAAGVGPDGDSRGDHSAVPAVFSHGARPGVFACLSVSDNGKGIPPEILPHIFEPFFTTKDVGKGTGLGLATVFGIIQQHQGWIKVTSETGVGTTFRIYLPLLHQPHVEPLPEPTPSAGQRGHETILLVEDEAALRTLVCTVLNRLGYRVLVAPNGIAALEVWKNHRPEINLLLTDLVMPEGLSGRDLAGRLLAENPQLKVIYTSGYSQEIAGEDFPLREGENFLTKPFQTAQLAKTIRARLES